MKKQKTKMECKKCHNVVIVDKSIKNCPKCNHFGFTCQTIEEVN